MATQMELANESWMGISNACNSSACMEFEGDLLVPALSFDCDYDFNMNLEDLHELEERLDDDYFKSIMNAIEDVDCHSLESSMSSEVSSMSTGCSPSPSPQTCNQESSKTPYSDATQCRRPANNGHIRRPMNPFMVFAKEERRRMSALTPNLHNAEISKICGRKWKNMTPDEKRPFEMESARLKLLHEKEYPDYKYRPKKKTKVVAKKRSDKNVTKRSLKTKVKVEEQQQPLNNEFIHSKFESKSTYLMVNGQKIPLNTSKSSDDKKMFNLQLKIDENYKIVPATDPSCSPVMHFTPPGGTVVKQESAPTSPVYLSFPGAMNERSFPPVLVPGKADDSDIKRLYLVIQCDR